MKTRTKYATGGALTVNCEVSSAEREVLSAEHWTRRAFRNRLSLRTHRSAFTLVELMMTLIIIGLLTTLLGVAVGFALTAARNTATKTEIANLDQALQSYKNNYGSEYPTSLAIPPTAGSNKTTPSRYDLFNRSLRKRFPRFTGDYYAVQTLLTQGNSSVSPVIPKWQVVSVGSGQAVTLDPDNLDAAEAIVFWLAGPPAPVGMASSTKVIGFSANPTNPFNVNPGSRLPFLYEFDETRLTDVDGDGWLEYTPKGSTPKSTGMAPFVYFEPNSFNYKIGLFTGTACYPGLFVISSNGPYNTPTTTFAQMVNMVPNTSVYRQHQQQIQTMINEWGFALPYANSFTPASSAATPWNPKKFQLIAAGLDIEYGGSQYETNGEGRQYVPVVPQTATQGSPMFLTQGDNDNLTNFIDSKVEDYVP